MHEWFYRVEGREEGPISEEDLKHIFDSAVLPRSTPVWSEGMQDWGEAQEVPEFTDLQSATNPIKEHVHKPSGEVPSIQSTTARLLVKGAVLLFVLICCISFANWLSQASKKKAAERTRNEAAKASEQFRNQKLVRLDDSIRLYGCEPVTSGYYDDATKERMVEQALVRTEVMLNYMGPEFIRSLGSSTPSNH